MLNYAGMHFPNGPCNQEKFFSLPSKFVMMLATEARYHYQEAVEAGKTVMWRAVPRIGFRPSELKYNINKCANEVLNLWDEQAHSGVEYFLPYNELDLNSERGDNQDDFSGLSQRYEQLGSFLAALENNLRQRLPAGVKIFFPPFTPDHGDVDHADSWKAAAMQYDGIVVHAYETADAIKERLTWFLREFPDKPIILGEWNGKDQQGIFTMLAELQQNEPNFLGASYFCWQWFNAPSWWPKDYNVEGRDDLYQLFLNPPVYSSQPETPVPQPPKGEPMTTQEVIDLICNKADQYGLDRIEFLGGAIAESNLNPNAERWGIWPDVSFGLFQQTVAYAEEGDHSNNAENIAYIKNLYEDPTHACDVAAVKFKYWRYDPDVSALTAWCAYNWPGSYHTPEINPNINNYRNGLEQAAQILGISASQVTTEARTFGPPVPDSVILQQNDWSCAVRSVYGATWLLHQVTPNTPDVTYGDNGPNDVYNWMVPTYDDPSVGLHDASGAGLVAMLQAHGYTAHNQANTTLANVQEVAGTKPVLIGGRAWNHWVAVRGLESDGTLMLANPSPGFAGISNELRDSFNKLGPFSMVTIDMPTQAQYSFQFGMADKAAELGHDVVGDPIENEHYIHDYISVQLTTTGMMMYVKLTGEVLFFKKP